MQSFTSISINGSIRAVSLFNIDDELPFGEAVYLLFSRKDFEHQTFHMPFTPLYIEKTNNMADVSFEDINSDILKQVDAVAILWKEDNENLDILLSDTKREFA